MIFTDEVSVTTPTVAEMNTAMVKVKSKLKGDWRIQRLSHLVSAYENKTKNIHLFNSHDPDEMAQELVLRDREVFTGDTWS